MSLTVIILYSVLYSLTMWSLLRSASALRDGSCLICVRPLPQRDTNHDVSYYFSLTTQPMESLGQVFPIQEVLLVKIDLGEVLPSALDIHPAGRAGGIASAVMRKWKAERLGRLQDRGTRRDLPAQALGMDERDPGHYATPPATAAGWNGHRFCAMCASNSERNVRRLLSTTTDAHVTTVQ